MDEFAEVLAHYPRPIRGLDWVRVLGAGGLSGAEIWSGQFGFDSPSEPLALAASCSETQLTLAARKNIRCAKRYPPGTHPHDLQRQHAWLSAATRAGLGYVPRMAISTAGETFVRVGGCIWEIQDWMPGRADFATEPTQAKLAAACEAVLRIHGVWRQFGTRTEPSRAIRNRAAMIARWRKDAIPPKSPLEQRAAAILARHLDPLAASLAEWVDRPLPCQPCVRDLRRDHFLFEGDSLTGLIDYGAADWDTPATDAARMLGELIGGDSELYGAGIERFREAGISADAIRILDRAGVVGAAIRWIYRLREPRTLGVPVEVAEARLGRLLDRLEREWLL